MPRRESQGSRLHDLRSVIQMSFEASVPRHESRRDTLSAVLCARPGPRHEIINARGRPQIDQFGQNVLDVGLRINAVELARLDERGDASPIGCALVAAGEQRVLASKRNLAVILPISGTTVWAHIAGIRCTDRGCVVFRASGAHRVSWCTWS